MLTQGTRQLLAKVIVTISKEQQGLETIRQVLAHQERFCPYTSFKRVKSADTSFICFKAAGRHFNKSISLKHCIFQIYTTI